jgi:hypothetical protein
MTKTNHRRLIKDPVIIHRENGLLATKLGLTSENWYFNPILCSKPSKEYLQIINLLLQIGQEALQLVPPYSRQLHGQIGRMFMH